MTDIWFTHRDGTRKPWPDPRTPSPSWYAYALAHRCSVCGAEPGQECNAPGKIRNADRRAGMRSPDMDALNRQHTVRISAGRRHRDRDIGWAPWPEDREQGRRYDSLGDLADPRNPDHWMRGQMPGAGS